MAWALLILVFCIHPCIIYSKLQVDPSTKLLIDEFGRNRIFHSINVVHKDFPYYPIQEQYIPGKSFSDEDIKNIRKWGFQAIRLFIPWIGFEPIEEQYNQTLLEKIREIVRKCSKQNVLVLLDAHQDLFNPKFCGEGFPDWTASSNQNFPFPLTFQPYKKFPPSGYPSEKDCSKQLWSLYYMAIDTEKAFQNLYENKNGLADKFGKFWKLVALYFKDEPNVIGQEIINEPGMGDYTKDIFNMILPGYNEKHQLQPFQEIIHNWIRSSDNETIIFFEPSPMIIPMEYEGFSQSPGGDDYKNRSVQSYHVQCPAPNFNGAWKSICKVIETIYFHLNERMGNKLGIAKYLTEQGIWSEDPLYLEDLDRVLGFSDHFFTSSAYWEYSWLYSEGTIRSKMMKILARTYAQAICGNPIQTSFSGTTGEQKLKYKAKSCKKNTELYLGEDFYYENGFTVLFEGCNNCKLSKLESKYYYEVVIPEEAIGSEITITIKKD